MEIKVILQDFQPEIVKIAESVGMPTMTTVFPHLVAAFNKAALLYQAYWRRFASGTTIPGAGGRTINSRGPYTRSIKVDDKGPFEKTIFTDYFAHKYIEDGTPETDLKPGLLYGPRSRPTADGGRINVVSFRHGVPGTLGSNNPMPMNIHNLMQQETRRAEAVRGSRLGGVRAVLPKGMGGDPETKVTQKFGTYTWKVGKHEGMQRIDTSTGRGKSSKYITFRTVSTNSDPASWIVPERPPIPIRKALVDLLQPEIELLLKNAFTADIGG